MNGQIYSQQRKLRLSTLLSMYDKFIVPFKVTRVPFATYKYDPSPELTEV